MQGPNVKKLIAHKMSVDMVPSGAGIADVIPKFEHLGEYARKATDWVYQAIRDVKSAPDNPYGDDDEAIAGEILKRLAPGKTRTYRTQSD